MLLAESSLLYVAQKVLDHLIGDVVDSGWEKLGSRVRGDPRRTALAMALARTEAKFASAYRDWHQQFFDREFLAGAAAPLLARTLERTGSVSGEELAAAWGRVIGGETGRRYAVELTPAADEFLGWWRDELGGFSEFRESLNAASLEGVRAASEGSRTALEELRVELERLDRAVLAGRYPALGDFLDAASRRASLTAQPLVGRDWVFDWLHEVAQLHKRAYLHVIADSGLGKTALAASIATRLGAGAFLYSERDGVTRPEQCLNHLAVELIDRFDLPHEHLPQQAGKSSSFLSQVIGEAADRATADIWLVVDALDEARGMPGGSNPGLLPGHLPPRVFVILTHRPGDYRLQVDPGLHQSELTIRADDRRQQLAVEGHVRHRLMEDNAVEAALSKVGQAVDIDTLVTQLTSLSEGNFLFAGYALDDFAASNGSIDLAQLPSGLHNYYRRKWQRVHDTHGARPKVWEALYRPIMRLLGAAQEPVSTGWLADHSGLPIHAVEGGALSAWRPLIQETEHGWRVVHQSVRDFLSKNAEADLVDAHASVARYYLDEPARRPAHGGYAGRHLTAHLRLSHNDHELFAVVDDVTWREQQLAHDLSANSFLTDLEHAWTAAVALDAAAVRDRLPLPELLREVRCALDTGELNATSAELPGRFLATLVQKNVLGLSGALAHVYRQSREQRIRSVVELAPHMPAGLPRLETEAIASEALAAVAGGVMSSLDTVHAVTLLAPHVSESAMTDAAQAFSRVNDAYDAEALSQLLGLLPDDTQKSVLNTALQNASSSPRLGTRVEAVAALLPHIGEPERTRRATEALQALVAAPNLGSFETAKALEKLTPHLAGAAVPAAVDRAMRISDDTWRAGALIAQVSYMAEPARSEAVEETLATARRIRDSYFRCERLTSLSLDRPSNAAGSVRA